MSLYPFRVPHLVDPQRKKAFDYFSERMQTLKDRDSGVVTFVARNRPVSFDLQEVTDLGQSEPFVQVGVCSLVMHF